MNERTVRARYFDGKTSKPYTLNIAIKEDHLELHDVDANKNLTPWYKSEIMVVGQNGNYSSFNLCTYENPDARLTITDPTGKDLIKRWLPKEAYPKHYASTNFTALFTYFLITVAILMALYQSFPLITGAIANMVPLSWEQKMGDRFFAQIETSLPVCPLKDNEAANEALEKINTRLTNAHDNQVEYEIHLIGSKDVNAFALPGNRILIMDGLIQQATSPDQLAAVLAHEIGHVRKRHVVHSIVKGQALYILFNLMTGGDSTSITSGAEFLSSIANLHNNRTHEYEADSFAVEILAKAQIDPNAVIDLLKLLQKQELKMKFLDQIPDFLLTHPDTQKRIQVANELIKKQPKPIHAYQEPLSVEEWQSIKTACAQTVTKKDGILDLIQGLMKEKGLEDTSKKKN